MKDPVTYNLDEESITKIVVNDRLISVDFIFEGIKWTKRFQMKD